MPSPEMMRCLDCGYDLHGLSENRCPECGRGFDPDDPATYARRVVSPDKCFQFSLLGTALTLLFIALVAAAAVVVSGHWTDTPVTLLLGIGAVLCHAKAITLSFQGIAAGGRHVREGVKFRIARFLSGALLAVTLIGMILLGVLLLT
jgi:hypothetical protein